VDRKEGRRGVVHTGEGVISIAVKETGCGGFPEQQLQTVLGDPALEEVGKCRGWIDQDLRSEHDDRSIAIDGKLG
jgi:hypothetical protein